MKRMRVSCIILWAFVALNASSLFGAIPQSISYQGRLTNAVGAPVNDTVDLVFDICADSLCSRPLWEESQTGVIVRDGLFAVLLGSITPIPPSVFSGSVRWLFISKDGVATSRTLRMVSAPYAYKSLMADTAYYAKSAGLDCAGCDGIFVNAIGPDSVVSTSGTALLGKVSGSSSSPFSGIQGYGSNSSSGSVYGAYGYAENTSNGTALGGYFETSNSGTGSHYGLKTNSYGASAASIYGVSGWASNTSAGDVYGGDFSTSSSGTGIHYGLRGRGYGSSDSTVYGVHGYASNSSVGSAYGGFFETSSSGTGPHYGLRVDALSGSPVSQVHGIYVNAENTSGADVTAGSFNVSNKGTESHTGIYVSSSGSSGNPMTGISCTATNNSSGADYAGYFWASALGTGTKYGIYSVAPAAAGYAGHFAGNTVTTGTKSAAVKVDNGEYRLLYAMESPENWFEDFGGGRLQDGVSTVQIDPLFAQAVNTQFEYRVFLTPEGDCRGLYVTNKTASSFEVRELQGGTTNISFSYRVVARRKGYEDLRMAKMLGPTPEETEAWQAKRQSDMERENQRMRQERPTTEKEPAKPEQE